MPTKTKTARFTATDYINQPVNLGGVLMTRGEWLAYYRNDAVPDVEQDKRTGWLFFCHDTRMEKQPVECRKCNDQGWYLTDPDDLTITRCGCGDGG